MKSLEVRECPEVWRIEVFEVKEVPENVFSGRSERSGGQRGLLYKGSRDDKLFTIDPGLDQRAVIFSVPVQGVEVVVNYANFPVVM